MNDIFKFFGEERESLNIAKNIIKERAKGPILSTPDLVEIIKRSKKKDFKKKINISTKTFQAIRIFVNKEFSELIEGLINATQLIKAGGKNKENCHDSPFGSPPGIAFLEKLFCQKKT